MDISKSLLEELAENLKTAKTYDDLMGKDGAIKKLIKVSLEQLLEAEMSAHLGYTPNARLPKAHGNRRNGTSVKTVSSDVGEIDLAIPRDREGEFDPVIVKKHQRRLGALQDAIISMYAKGMSTRDIQQHLEDIYSLEVSASTVSTITETVMHMVHEWQNRPLEPLYPIVFFDAIHYKVRFEGKIITKAAYTCLGVDLNGNKDLLGLWIGQAEGATFWLGILNELRTRGVQDILIACVDGLRGFPDAITTVFPHTEVQQCVIHQIRQSVRYVSSKHYKTFLRDLRTVYTAPTEAGALDALDQLENTWGTRYPLSIKSWRTNWPYLATYYRYPPELRPIMYTTNAVEALHRQFRKVTNAKTIFPTDESLLKMLFLAYRDLSKKWTRPILRWHLILAQLTIIFEQRVTKYL
jgi:transposase-like protein